MDLCLKDKKALVMASSAGIGKAIATSLIEEGAQVALCARSEKALKSTSRDIGAAYEQVCDLLSPGAAKKLTRDIIAKFGGGLDILVTNCGGPAKNDFLNVTEQQWKDDFQTLWLSVVDALHVAIPLMKERGYGRILLVTSVAAKEPMANLTTSNGLRAGLAGLAKTLSNEVAPYGITVNTLLPGFTNTNRLKDLNLSQEVIRGLIPAGRPGEPWEVGALAAFLASPKAGYITGQSITIDGGYLKSH